MGRVQSIEDISTPAINVYYNLITTVHKSYFLKNNNGKINNTRQTEL